MRFALGRLFTLGRLPAPLGRLPVAGILAAVLAGGLLIGHSGVVRAETEPTKAKSAAEIAAAADPDFRIQGEYQGSLKLDGRPDTPVGVQIVAGGNHQFEAILFDGGLPGAGWKASEGRKRADGKTDDGRIEFHSDRWNAVLLDEKLSLTAADGSPMGMLAKVERQSPTLGQAPPDGGVVLFDGSSVDQWIGGRITEDRSLAAGTVTKTALRDFFLHVEFCLPFSPRSRGQQRANSGVYLANRYEVQVLDSFGLDGQNNECGALYSLRAPDVNMCFPPLRWQTYDIDFTAARFDAERNKLSSARVSVKHNGVVIHDEVEIDRPTTAGVVKEYPGTGPLQLQWHFATVTYRNIWFVEKNRPVEKE